MSHFIKRFMRDEQGAVTVDWVVLCAGVVVIAVAIVTAMQAGALSLGDSVTEYMSSWTF